MAFESRNDLEKCKVDSGDDWDSDEIYFVIDDLKKFFSVLLFTPKSYCSGIIEISK